MNINTIRNICIIAAVLLPALLLCTCPEFRPSCCRTHRGEAAETSPATYMKGEDSLLYEEIGGRRVHVMFVDGVPKRLDTLSLSQENYFDVCEFYGITDAEIVYAQSCLESGHFSSSVYRKKNNHLGIRRKSGYVSYPDWTACLKDYSDKVARRKRDGEDHYAFLTRIGYAEDGEYVSKVKSVVLGNRKRHRNAFGNVESSVPGASEIR